MVGMTLALAGNCVDRTALTVIVGATSADAGYQQYDAGEAAKADAYNEMVFDVTNAWKPKEVRDAERALRDAQRKHQQ
jgi:hypothetical protein